MRVIESYSFVPGPRGQGTITIPEVLRLQDFAHIWNSTRGALIFDVKNSQFGILNVYISSGTTVLQIETNTSTMDASDVLQILIYDAFPETPGTSFAPNDGANDAFGRLRTSTPYTLADYKATYGLSSEFLTFSSGAGSNVTFIPTIVASRLTVGVDAGDFVVRQTRMYHHYQPGKSQFALFSFVFSEPREGAIKRIGLFDDRNGAFLRLDGNGNLSWVERRFVTGSPEDFPVAQTNWNVDRCDGTGPSGFELDPTKSQLLFIDYQWLGVGRVRVGFVHDGKYIVAHEFYHSNSLSTVYWTQSSLPLRAEIRAETDLLSPATMDIMCASVQAEGGYSESGNDFSASTSLRTIGNEGAQLPVLAIRLSNSLNGFPNRITARVSDLEGFSSTGGFRFDLIRLASSSQLSSTAPGGIVWTPRNGISGVEYSSNATNYTPNAFDQVITSFFIPAGGGASRPASAGLVNPASARLSYISQNIASDDSQAFVVLATSLGNNATAAVALQWRELQ